MFLHDFFFPYKNVAIKILHAGLPVFEQPGCREMHFLEKLSSVNNTSSTDIISGNKVSNRGNIQSKYCK